MPLYLRQIDATRGEAVATGLERLGHALVHPLLRDAERGGDLLTGFALHMRHHENISKIRS